MFPKPIPVTMYTVAEGLKKEPEDVMMLGYITAHTCVYVVIIDSKGIIQTVSERDYEFRTKVPQ